MSRKCPECGKTVSDATHFCSNCGYNFQQDSEPKEKTNLTFFSKLFAVLIVIVVIIGAIAIVNMGMNFNKPVDNVQSEDSSNPIELTITDVKGNAYDDDNETDYYLSTEALFTKVPDNLEGYIIKTTYYDENGTSIAHNTEGLSTVIYDDADLMEYSLSFGYVSSHKALNPDHVTVEITKSSNTVFNDTYEVDKNSIEYLD